MKQKPIQYKSMGGDIRTDGRVVSGYLASFGNKDSDGDVIVKGAFAKSLNDRGVNSTTARKIAYLYQHDITKPIGRFKTLLEDETGLYFEAELDNIPLANDVLEQYKSGTLNQHSIGFRPIWDKAEWDSDTNTLYYKEVDLFEGSVVTLGANENTPFIGLKSEQRTAEIEALRRDTEAALKYLPFEDQYRIRQLISKHISLAEVAEPVKEAIQQNSEPKIDVEAIIKHLKTI